MADGYSKIESVEIFNFMPYEHAKAFFDENGIINLKGYNSVGKSAFNTALAVCLMNMYSSKQGKFIKHDTKYFRVIVNFNDGISILRDKYDNGQSLYEMYDEGKCIFSTKQGSKLTKIYDVPTPIKTYLDLIETENSYLNFQDRKSPLWLIETTGSENYKDLHSVLKVEEISRANAMLNSDLNALNSEIVTLESELQRKELQLQSIQGLDKAFINSLTEKNLEVKELSNRDDLLHSICAKNDELISIKVSPAIDKIAGAGQIRDIESLGSLITKVEGIKISPKVEGIKTGNRLTVIEKILEDLREIEANPVQYSKIGSVEGIDKQKALAGIWSTLVSVGKVRESLKKCNAEQEELVSKKAVLMEEAKAEGKILVECENCGTLMEVNTGGIQ